MKKISLAARVQLVRSKLYLSTPISIRVARVRRELLRDQQANRKAEEQYQDSA